MSDDSDFQQPPTLGLISDFDSIEYSADMIQQLEKLVGRIDDQLSYHLNAARKICEGRLAKAQISGLSSGADSQQSTANSCCNQ